MGWIVGPALVDFPNFASEWDQLNRRIGEDHPLVHSRFIGPLLAHLGRADDYLCIHRTSGQADAAMLLRSQGWGRWSLFRHPLSPFGALLISDASLLDSLLDALPGFAWSVDLQAIDPTLKLDWRGLQRPRVVLRGVPAMWVELEGGFDDYLSTHPERVSNDFARNQGLGASTHGQGKVAPMVSSTRGLEAIERHLRLMPGNWKGKVGAFIATPDDQSQHYAQSLRCIAEVGQVQVLELYLGGALAASLLLVGNNRTWAVVSASHDAGLSHQEPEQQLLMEAIGRAFSELPTGSRVELHCQATHDQAKWATSLHHVERIRIFRNQSIAAVDGLLSLFPATPENFPGRDGDGCSPVPRISRLDTVSQLPPPAKALFEAAAAGYPELSLDWFDNLQKAVFGADPGAGYYLSATGDVVHAIIPVRTTGTYWAKRIESLGNYYTSLYSPLLAPDTTAADIADLFRAATKESGKAHMVRLWPLDPESRNYELLLAGLRSAGWLPFRYFCFGNWYLEVTSSWADYLKARDGQLRSTLRRMGKKFSSAGGAIQIITTAAEAEVATRAFNQVYASSWKRPEPYPEFVPGLVRWLAAKGELRLGIALLDNQPVAAQIWMVSHGRASIFKLAYDEAYAAYSPGTLLTARLLEQVIDQDRVIEVDYLIGDDRHKERWMSHRRERWGIVAYNPRSLIGLGLLFREILGRSIRRLTGSQRQHDHTENDIMNWTLYPIRDFEQHAVTWDKLHGGRSVPFLESAFLLPLIREFANGSEKLALASHDGELRAAAIVTPLGVGRWQTFQPSQLPLGAWLAAPEVDVSKASSSLLQALPGPALSLGLTQLDPLLTSRPDDDSRQRTMDYINTAWVDVDQSFDAYWEARGKNLKSNTRKQRSKLQTEEVITTLDILTRPEQVVAALADYGRLESTGWKGKDGTAVHPDNAQGRFYRQMLEGFCTLGRGCIYSYRFNGQVVAMDLCIEAGDRMVILKTAYDETYKSVSPSTLMRQEEFRALFDDGKIKRIEFYGKVMEWHSRWTDQSRTLYHLTRYRWPVLNALHRRYQTWRSGRAS